MQITDSIDQKRVFLEEKIKTHLTEKGEEIESHAEAIKEFLSVLPKTHVDRLIAKFEELEGAPKKESYAFDTADVKTEEGIDSILQIRNALGQGDIAYATSLAKSLYVVE